MIRMFVPGLGMLVGPGAVASGAPRVDEVPVTGEEAHHAARVRRVEVGEAVELIDGVGLVASGAVARVEGGKREPTVVVRVGSALVSERVRPSVRVRSAVPKGGRLEDMVEQLSQVGAWSWGPVVCARSESEVRGSKAERLERVVVESAKQCGRAWLMEIEGERGLEEVIAGSEGLVLMADASGEAILPALVTRLSGSLTVTVVVGPEGGFTAGEVEQARAWGAWVVSLGPHVMRLETAAVVGAALVAGALAGGGRRG